MPTTPDKKIAFVAGATGYTGSALVPLLIDAGWAVYAHVRPDSPSLDAWVENFEAHGAFVDTTPWDEAAVRQRFECIKPNAIFALLGTTKKRAKSPTSAIEDTYMAVDYGLTALLRRAAEDAAPSARFVYLSALGVSPNSRSGYVRARAKLEAELREGDLDYTIIRPAIIAGDREDSRKGEEFGAAAVAGVVAGLRLVGARRAAANFRTRSGHELAQNCLDAALRAPNRSELSGAALDALAQR